MRDGSPSLKCYRCGEEKPADEFAWRRKGRAQRDSFCRPCRKAYGREHYEANRERYIAQAAVRTKARRAERAVLLIDYFASHPCTDCGETDPLVLEFDHLRDKAFNISAKLVYRSWEAILTEIKKCEVVCANCHRRRTGRRLGSHRVLALEGRQE